MKKLGKLFIISAPSGAGKTSLANALVERMKSQCAIERVVTYTSREQREGEVHGIDYYFVTPEEFEQKIKEEFFVEWSTTYGTYYGSPKTIVGQLEQGSSLVCILDRVGTRAMCTLIPDAVRIWLTNDLSTLEQRLRDRGAHADEQLQARLALAAQELAEEKAEKFYQYHLFSDDFEKTIKELLHICACELNKE